MERFVNIIIGAVIALLPLYTKIESVDVGRVCKDNLLVVVFGILSFMLSGRKRKLSLSLALAISYAFIILVFNQSNSAAIIVIMHTFYISAGLVFFASFYERHSKNGLENILNGMATGCLIQCLLVISENLGFDAYDWVMTLMGAVGESGGVIYSTGSLGNTNLLASYVTLTSVALMREKLWPLLIFPVVTLVLSESLMGIGSFIAAVLYLLNSRFDIIERWLLYLSASTGMLSIYLLRPGKLDSLRFSAWDFNLVNVDISHLLIGKGPGWFATQKIILPDRTIMAQEHNEFLAIFNIFGITGILLLIPVLKKILTNKNQNKYFGAVGVGAGGNDYGHFNLHQSTTAIIIIVALAICLAGKDSHVK